MAAPAGLDERLAAQRGERLAERDDRDAELPGERALGRELIALGEQTEMDGVGDLLAHGVGQAAARDGDEQVRPPGPGATGSGWGTADMGVAAIRSTTLPRPTTPPFTGRPGSSSGSPTVHNARLTVNI